MNREDPSPPDVGAQLHQKRRGDAEDQQAYQWDGRPDVPEKDNQGQGDQADPNPDKPWVKPARKGTAAR